MLQEGRLECIASTPPDFVEVVVREGFEIETVASITPVFIETIVRRKSYFGVFGE